MTPTLSEPPLAIQAGSLGSCGDYGGNGCGGGDVPSDEWMTTGDAATRLGISLTYVRALIDQPRPPFEVIRIGETGKHRRVSRASVEAYLEALRIRDPAERDLAIEALRRRYAGEDYEQRLSALGASEEDIKALNLGSIEKRPPRAG
jgi:excisionase family DNA binding protein